MSGMGLLRAWGWLLGESGRGVWWGKDWWRRWMRYGFDGRSSEMDVMVLWKGGDGKLIEGTYQLLISRYR
jgi:hypothetical protein